MSYDVITFGSATIDAFLHTDNELIEITAPGMHESFIAYPSGTKMLVKSLAFHWGGGGTNAAVTFARMGLKTAWCGILGNDENGKHIRGLLKKEKITFLGKTVQGMTGYSVILDSIAHDRTILAYKGVNDHVPPLPKQKAQWYYVASLTGKAFKLLPQLFQQAQKKGIMIAFNPSSYLVKEKRKQTLALLPKVTALILNIEEAKVLLGYEEGKIINPEQLLKELHLLGPTYCVITDGPQGLYAYAEKHYYHLTPRKIKVVESTGAGDAFASGFITGLIKKQDIPFALNLGLTNAESVIGSIGAKEGILTWRKAVQLMKRPVRLVKKSSA